MCTTQEATDYFLGDLQGIIKTKYADTKIGDGTLSIKNSTTNGMVVYDFTPIDTLDEIKTFKQYVSSEVNTKFPELKLIFAKSPDEAGKINNRIELHFGLTKVDFMNKLIDKYSIGINSKRRLEKCKACVTSKKFVTSAVIIFVIVAYYLIVDKFALL